MSHLFSLVSALALMAVVSCPVRAESNWKLPNLNPFSKKSDTAAPPKKSSRLKMPNLLPSWGEKKSRRSSEPSTWNKFSNGTKSFVGKTTDVLTPWDTAAEKKAKRSSNNQRLSFNKPARKEEKKSFFASWLPEKEEPKRPRSVAEFLKQPRPGP